ncbi:phosphoheptose isomerase [Candidatus Pelagibacter sp.]|jgi:capsule biosynthesis phosphatase|nr:phosphoheptose isomerase [Candidatus Pelagibacter sp.]MDC1483267.1 phosphoheptose isomerase [Pelagibacteraceae bacterium]|tara:strand:- start:150 stop:503 length:354 start_codon:yes stop_codon:yes gene_type:complete
MKKKICFDLDNTICSTTKNYYRDSKPKKNIIRLINNLDPNKFEIIIFTARFMGRYKENAQKAKSIGFKFTQKQLASWGLRYDKLILGKPSYDIIIDDKSLGFAQKNVIKFLKKNLKK